MRISIGTIDKNIEKYGEYIESIDNKYQVPFPSVCEQYWHDKKIENIDKLLRISIKNCGYECW